MWSIGKADEVMAGLTEYVDVRIANEEDAADVPTNKVNHGGYKEVQRS